LILAEFYNLRLAEISETCRDKLRLAKLRLAKLRLAEISCMMVILKNTLSLF
jgi:hypothetical protein